MTRPPLSALELATVNVDQTTADALADSIEVAQVAEELGFTRLWVAEHHNMGSVGSTNPPVLIAAIAARTERIRVGSGGVMLPNHAPYVVAEQFALLEALHPGRIDLGLGRAPGTDQFTARALRRTGHDDVDQFPNHVLQLMSWLGDNRLTEPLSDRLSVTPKAVSYPEIWLLGSSGYAAQLAGMLGLRYCYAHHFGTLDPAAVMNLYRESFEPSPVLDEPYAMVCTSALSADTAEEAEFHAGPSRMMALELRRGNPRRVVSPEVAAERGFTDHELEQLKLLPAVKFVGTHESVLSDLDALIEATGVQELMLTGSTYGAAPKINTYRALTERW